MVARSINWRVRSLDQLNIFEVYEMLKLRAEVFVVEQNCPYQDLDGLDKQASISLAGLTMEHLQLTQDFYLKASMLTNL